MTGLILRCNIELKASIQLLHLIYAEIDLLYQIHHVVENFSIVVYLLICYQSSRYFSCVYTGSFFQASEKLV